MIPEKAQLAIARIENKQVKFVGLQKINNKVYAIVNKEKRFKSRQMDNLLKVVLRDHYAKEFSLPFSISELESHTTISYQDMVASHIFEPLGMMNSDFDSNATLITTAADLTKFAIFCMERGYASQPAARMNTKLSSLLFDTNKRIAFLILSDLDDELFSIVVQPFCHPMLAGEGIGRLIKAI